ncbi:hypothetical protein HZ994_06470 [Akkermansiaceae bacterium]|nr:hypothetical protein HZ994_06470 [Akkermansiaceae bacterium]
MNIPAPAIRLARIIGISAIAAAALGLCSCVSQSEKDFAAQHGYKRSDYFGAGQNKNFVPAGVRRPEYFYSESEPPMGRPGF